MWPTYIAVALLCLPVSALASAGEECDELWFSRNAMMDYAGYCFQSPLGQAVFDNSDCTTSEPQLSPAAAAMTQQIIKNEATLACDVDTNRTGIGRIWNMAQRRELEVQPPVLGTWKAEFFCGGYKDTISIYAAPNHDSRVLDVMQPGGTISFERHVQVRDKTYEVLAQLLPDDEEGYAGDDPGGAYWMFVVTRQADADEVFRQGWVFRSRQPDFWGLCTAVAG